MASIELIARAFIEKDGKVLLCHGKGNKNWFFPGGHIEEGESAPVALLREINEEMGATGKVRAFLGASENKFEINGKITHEINLVFEVALSEGSSYESKEDHLEFSWFSYDEIREMLVFPLSLRDAILAFQTKQKIVWASEGFE